MITQKLQKLQTELDKLHNAMLPDFNLFEAVGVSTQEVRHSAFLGYLLDPTKPHGLGKQFASKFLEALLRYSSNVDISDLAQNIKLAKKSLDGCQVVLEAILPNNKRPDIVLLNKKTGFLLLIENKVETVNHSQQLSSYLGQRVDQKDFDHCIYVYLTPHGDSPKRSEALAVKSTYCLFDYNQIVQIANSLLNDQKLGDFAAKTLLGDYVKMVEKQVLHKTDSTKLCKDISAKYKEEITILYNYTHTLENARAHCTQRIAELVEGIVGDTAEKFTKTLQEFFQRHGECVKDGCLKARIYVDDKHADMVLCFGLQAGKGGFSPAQRILIDNIPKRFKSSKGEKYHTFVRVVCLHAGERTQDWQTIQQEVESRIQDFAQKVNEKQKVIQSL